VLEKYLKNKKIEEENISVLISFVEE